MSKNTWASIVKTKEILPTEVIVPEPPLPAQTAAQSAVTGLQTENTNTESHNDELARIRQTKESLDKEIKFKRDKFTTSYAYTRFNQDIDYLNQQRTQLEERETTLKYLILLDNGPHAKRALEVVRRIKAYLGSEPDYKLRYTKFDNTRRMTFSIICDLSRYFFTMDGAGLEWEIKESVGVEYDCPNNIHIHFSVESPEMGCILEAAIKTELPCFAEVIHRKN